MMWAFILAALVAAFLVGKALGYRRGAEHGLEIGAYTYEQKLEDVFGDQWANDLADGLAARANPMSSGAQWN